MEGIHTGSIPTKRSPSRNGPVLMVEEPVIITYERPRERVLFNAARDASPFLHLYESLWMLAGRENVAPLAYYAKNFLNYSDDGVTLNGAYGRRWRHADTSVEPRDQLEILIEHLRDKPESRRAVLQMWDVENDLLNIDESRDVCCNLSVMFSIRREDMRVYPVHGDYKGVGQGGEEYTDYLDMTVTNRSNDMIWGTLGANVVHFSFLQEYMAAHLGVEVGVYNQVSNNIHVYESNWKPEEWLAAPPAIDLFYAVGEPYMPFSLIKDPTTFDKAASEFVTCHSGPDALVAGFDEWEDEPFLIDVADPMLSAFHNYKTRDYDAALRWVDHINADDWRIAAKGWLERRINKKEKAQ